ncbi:programmed cell death 1 ligand 1-like isoform X2 [Maylandia zebra]|uniref:programmed cell death 1 ligand 1-like isoform X2 n=1 Tax=Maylandia zebra TaxID=106582 RepID=UPI00403C58F4
MAGIKCVVFLVVLTFQWTFVKADTEVSCIFMERCMLPCSYGGSDVVIHWHQVSAGDITVHSFYHNKDQLEHQNQRFRGRTSLFNDQISTGNASLQLTKVEVRDEGKYKCYTSTIDGNKESFINLKIDAPIQKVSIQQVGNIITCSSEGIYPKPELTWSTSPSSNITSKNITVQPTERLLYNISSSLIPSSSDRDLKYSCTISTRRNGEKATLFKPNPPNDSSQSLHPNQLRATIGGIIGGLFVIAVLAAVLWWMKIKGRFLRSPY